MAVRIEEREIDGNWTVYLEWASARTIHIEDGEIRELRDALNAQFPVETEKSRFLDNLERNANFGEALKTLINKHSMENESNTPDYILTRYIRACMVAFANAVDERDRHKGVN